MKQFKTTCATTLFTALMAAYAGGAFADGNTAATQNPNASSGTTQSGASGMNAGQAGSSGASASSGSSGQSATSGQSGSAGQQGASSGASGGAKQAAPPTVVMMVPIQVASQNAAMKQGCWAKVYDRENYIGDSLTLIGSVGLPDMDVNGPFGLNWDDKVNSIELGPRARVLVYDNENYLDPVAEFKPGQRVADISKRMGFFDEFASVRIDCQQA